MADNSGIKLFKHNVIAYNSTVQMPCRTDKTAKFIRQAQTNFLYLLSCAATISTKNMPVFFRQMYF